MDSKPKRKNHPPDIYRLSRRSSRTMVVLVLCYFYIAVKFAEFFDGTVGLIRFCTLGLSVILFFVLCLVTLDVLRVKRLIISANSLKSVDGSEIIVTRWEDLTHFGWQRWGRSLQWGVWTDRAECYQQREWKEKRRPIFIPLSSPPMMHGTDRRVDMRRFKETSPGKDLLHFAPHLFDNSKSGHTDHTDIAERLRKSYEER